MSKISKILFKFSIRSTSVILLLIFLLIIYNIYVLSYYELAQDQVIEDKRFSLYIDDDFIGSENLYLILEQDLSNDKFDRIKKSDIHLMFQEGTDQNRYIAHMFFDEKEVVKMMIKDDRYILLDVDNIYRLLYDIKTSEKIVGFPADYEALKFFDRLEK